MRIFLALEIDVTVKPLNFRKEDTAIGYNPQKPGIPSHVNSSYFVAKVAAITRALVSVRNRPAIRPRPNLKHIVKKCSMNLPIFRNIPTTAVTAAGPMKLSTK